MKVSISALEGNRQALDGGAMFGNVPRPLWSKWLKPDEQGRIELACRCMLLEIGPWRVLCETGIGAFFEPKLAARFGIADREHRLLASLGQLGLTDADIDFVILSHLHFDHAGGLLPAFVAPGGKPTRLLFPKARYVVGREAWDRASHPHPRDRASFIDGLTDLLTQSGRLVMVEGKLIPDAPAELQERISFCFSHGHTPGQMHTICRGDARTVVFCGDLVPGLAWVHLPVTMGYDRFAELVIDEKKQFYERAQIETWTLFYTHDPNVAMSELRVSGDGKFEGGTAFATPVRMSL